MPVTLKDLADEWRCQQDLYRAQIELMKDGVFPDHRLSEFERNDVRSSLELMIARFDELLVKYGSR